MKLCLLHVLELGSYSLGHKRCQSNAIKCQAMHPGQQESQEKKRPNYNFLSSLPSAKQSQHPLITLFSFQSQVISVIICALSMHAKNDCIDTHTHTHIHILFTPNLKAYPQFSEFCLILLSLLERNSLLIVLAA